MLEERLLRLLERDREARVQQLVGNLTDGLVAGPAVEALGAAIPVAQNPGLEVEDQDSVLGQVEEFRLAGGAEGIEPSIARHTAASCQPSAVSRNSDDPE